MFHYAILFLIFFSFQVQAEYRRKGVTDVVGEPGKNNRKFALVIGINEYSDSQIGNLQKAENDATGVSKILLKFGEYYQIETVIYGGKDSSNQTKFSIEEKFDEILDKMEPDDSLFFYFSGHGITDYDEKNYLLASDSSVSSLIGTSISVDDLIARTRVKKLKKVIFVLDACRNPDKSTQTSGPKFLNGIQFNDVEQVAILYSTKLGYFSYEDDKSAYGVFTKFLIYGLEGRADSNFNAEITFTELSDYVSNSLKEWSSANKKNQKPFVKYYGEKSEDLVLTYASNPEFSLADLKVYDPYDNRYFYRSLVFPGWGQYARGEEQKGSFFLGVGSVILIATMKTYLDYRQAKKDYDLFTGLPPTTRFGESFILNYYLLEPKQQALDVAEANVQKSTGVLGIFYTLNLIDIAFFASKPNLNDRKFGFSLIREPNLINAAKLEQSIRYEICYQFHF